MRSSEAALNGIFPSKAWRTMPSKRSPRLMSWYSAKAFRTLSRRFSMRTPVCTRSTSSFESSIMCTNVPQYLRTRQIGRTLFILRALEPAPKARTAMTVTVFVGTSVDGFIARPNGALDFLPAGGGEPHGYDEFMASVDALVIGRKTFETVLAYPVWPYGDKRVVVLSSRPVELSAVRGAVVEQMSGAPEEIVSKL